MDGGERAKDFSTYLRVLDRLEAANVQRRDTLVCVGGSSISDMGGFVAATYLRGIHYINVPTTVLGQVDGSLGGKVALNTSRAKNAVGAFWHPVAIYVDHSWLRTLNADETRHGLAESVKVACVDGDGGLLELIESLGERLVDDPALRAADVIRLSLEAKLKLLADDPFEVDLRRFLNLGHTVAHPLERATGFSEVHHGAAVAIGIATACRYGAGLNLTSPDYAARIIELLARLGLPTSVHPNHAELVVQDLESVRRVRGGRLNYVVPVEPGQARILDDVNADGLFNALIAG